MVFQSKEVQVSTIYFLGNEVYFDLKVTKHSGSANNSANNSKNRSNSATTATFEVKDTPVNVTRYDS
jgi:hypothetical protein